MQTKILKASYEKDGKAASRQSDVKEPFKVAESVQDLLALFDGKAEGLVSFVNSAREAEETGKLYQTARLEIVGVEDKISRLANRINRDRVAVGKPAFADEKALAIARAQLE